MAHSSNGTMYPLPPNASRSQHDVEQATANHQASALFKRFALEKAELEQARGDYEAAKGNCVGMFKQLTSMRDRFAGRYERLQDLDTRYNRMTQRVLEAADRLSLPEDSELRKLVAHLVNENESVASSSKAVEKDKRLLEKRLFGPEFLVVAEEAERQAYMASLPHQNGHFVNDGSGHVIHSPSFNASPSGQPRGVKRDRSGQRRLQQQQLQNGLGLTQQREIFNLPPEYFKQQQDQQQASQPQQAAQQPQQQAETFFTPLDASFQQYQQQHQYATEMTAPVFGPDGQSGVATNDFVDIATLQQQPQYHYTANMPAPVLDENGQDAFAGLDLVGTAAHQQQQQQQQVLPSLEGDFSFAQPLPLRNEFAAASTAANYTFTVEDNVAPNLDTIHNFGAPADFTTGFGVPATGDFDYELSNENFEELLNSGAFGHN